MTIMIGIFLTVLLFGIACLGIWLNQERIEREIHLESRPKKETRVNPDEARKGGAL